MPSTTPAALGGELRLALTRISRRLRAERGEADLPEGQFSILTTLHHHDELSPSALAQHEGVKPPSMTRSVNAMAELGLVEKIEHPSDGRQVVVRLTERGKAEVHETRRRRDAWLARQLKALTPEERAVLAQATELITRIARR